MQKIQFLHIHVRYSMLSGTKKHKTFQIQMPRTMHPQTKYMMTTETRHSQSVKPEIQVNIAQASSHGQVEHNQQIVLQSPVPPGFHPPNTDPHIHWIGVEMGQLLSSWGRWIGAG